MANRPGVGGALMPFDSIDYTLEPGDVLPAIDVDPRGAAWDTVASLKLRARGIIRGCPRHCY